MLIFFTRTLDTFSYAVDKLLADVDCDIVDNFDVLLKHSCKLQNNIDLL